ncbi:MAG: hypothetical protein AAF402_10605 [Pseudomonadota bacterium]
MENNHSSSHLKTVLENVRNAGWIRLDHFSCFRITGVDAESFLHGQFTNDVLSLQPGHASLNGYCNPKGRLLATFWLGKTADESYLIFLPAVIAETTVRRLKMFVMRAKVVIEPVAGGVLAGASDDPCKDQHQVALNHSSESALFLRVSEARTETDVSGETLWRELDILSGIGMVYSETVESFIPQMINLDLAEGVNFSKGCYPGQEIVARLRYLGKLKQRAVCARIRTPDDAAVISGDAVTLVADASKKSGEIIDAVSTGQLEDGELEWVALAMVPSTHIAEGSIFVSGHVMERIDLPYEITVEKPKGRVKVT